MVAARAITVGILSEESLDTLLREKLHPLVEDHRDLNCLEGE